MLIYKLEAVNDWQKAKWYFRSIEEMNKFIGVFKNHGCNINWKHDLIDDVFEDLDDYDLEEMDKDPIKRAKSEMDWVFNSYLKHNPHADVSIKIAEGVI